MRPQSCLVNDIIKPFEKVVFIIVVFIKSKLTKSYIFKRWDDSPVG